VSTNPRQRKLEQQRVASRKWRLNHLDDARARDKLRKRKPRSKAKRKDTYLKRVYGISLIEYNALLEMQEGKCSICRISKCRSGHDFAVDHCHKTGKIRSLLCQSCNTILGSVQEKVEILQSAIEYIEKFQEKS